MVASRVYSSLPVRSGPLTLYTAQNHIFLPKDAQGGREIAVASVLCSGGCTTRTLCPQKPLATETEEWGRLRTPATCLLRGERRKKEEKWGKPPTHQGIRLALVLSTGGCPTQTHRLLPIHKEETTQGRINAGIGANSVSRNAHNPPTLSFRADQQKVCQFCADDPHVSAYIRRNRTDSGCTAVPSKWTRGHRPPKP